MVNGKWIAFNIQKIWGGRYLESNERQHKHADISTQ